MTKSTVTTDITADNKTETTTAAKSKVYDESEFSEKLFDDGETGNFVDMSIGTVYQINYAAKLKILRAFRPPTTENDSYIPIVVDLVVTNENPRAAGITAVDFVMTSALSGENYDAFKKADRILENNSNKLIDPNFPIAIAGGESVSISLVYFVPKNHTDFHFAFSNMYSGENSYLYSFKLGNDVMSTTAAVAETAKTYTDSEISEKLINDTNTDNVINTSKSVAYQPNSNFDVTFKITNESRSELTNDDVYDAIIITFELTNKELTDMFIFDYEFVLSSTSPGGKFTKFLKADYELETDGALKNSIYPIKIAQDKSMEISLVYKVPKNCADFTFAYSNVDGGVNAKSYFYYFELNDKSQTTNSETTKPTQHAMLGIEGKTITEEYIKTYGLDINNGVIITGVDSSDMAGRDTLKRNDIITNVNSKVIASIDDIKEAIKGLNPGDTVDITIYCYNDNDDGRSLTISFSLISS